MNRRKFLATTILGAGGAISVRRASLSAAQTLESHDAYIRPEPNRWVIGTAVVGKVITLSNGRLVLTSFKNKFSGREYVQSGALSNEVRLTADGREITGGSGGWESTGADSLRSHNSFSVQVQSAFTPD